MTQHNANKFMHPILSGDVDQAQVYAPLHTCKRFRFITGHTSRALHQIPRAPLRVCWA